MNKAQFLQELKIIVGLGSKFKLSPSGRIRTDGENNSCPIAQLAFVKTGIRYDNGSVIVAADKIKLLRQSTMAIVYAADNNVSYDNRTRRELLAACGLKEK